MKQKDDNLKLLQVKLTEQQLETMRELAKEEGYSTLSEFVRREILMKKRGNGEVIKNGIC